MKMFRSCVCCFSLILLLISIGIIAISLYIHLDFAQIMENRIKSEMIIKEENVFYDDFVNSKTTERTNFYVFEVENPNEILNGMKPKVKEVGPFVFRVERIKEKVTFSFDKTIVSYVERKAYYFLEIMSSGSIDHKITTTNLQFMVLNPMLSQLAQTSNNVSSRTNNSMVYSIFEIFGSNVFVSKSIREILFGNTNTDQQMEKISRHFPNLSTMGISVPQLLTNSFSLFPNNTEQKFEVFTGYKTGLYGRVLKWNDKSTLSVWSGRSCNQINGSHGYQFSPLIDSTDKFYRIYEYSTEMCRSVELSYEYYFELEGIPLLRFSPVDDIFHGPLYNQKNKCYCLSPETPEKCNFKGIIDLSSCTSGAPLILSNPHFRRASEVIAKSVVGMSPDQELHESYVEIEPITGLVVHRKRRYQFNVHIRKSPLNQNLGKYLKESIIPMVWFEEVSERDESTKDLIRLLFIYPTQYEELIALSLIGLAGLLMVISLCCCCCCGKNKKIDPISNQENNVSEKPIQAISGQTSDNTVDLSHSYDQIFKGQTPLNRLKENPLKRPSTVRQKIFATDPKLMAPQFLSPPPPPPPPPPPAVPQVVPISINCVNSDSRQNLLKDIRNGTKLKKVNKTPKTDNNLSIVSVSNEKTVQKGPIMTSLAKELAEHMRRKSLDNYSSVNQSYYRWQNNNQTNCSTLDRRTSFREPPVPIRKASVDSQELMKQKKMSTQPSIESLDSDFSDFEEQFDNESEDRKRLLRSLQIPEHNLIIKRSNSVSYDYNPYNQSTKSYPIITDIYHIVNSG